MRIIVRVASTALLLGSSLWGQSDSPGGREAWARPSDTASTTTFEVVLNRTLDVRKSKVGDIVIARTSDDVRLPGDVQIPKNAKVLGRVTEIQVKGRGASESRIGVIFERALVRDGRAIPLRVAIQAVAAAEDPFSASPMAANGATAWNASGPKQVRVLPQDGEWSKGSILKSGSDNLRVESGSRLTLSVIEQ